MTRRTDSLSQVAITEHLSRAEELGVSLREYAHAWDVNLKTLADAKASKEKHTPSELLPNDFIKVKVEQPVRAGSVCTLSHPGGWALECHEWPPAAWLRSLQGAEGKRLGKYRARTGRLAMLVSFPVFRGC